MSKEQRLEEFVRLSPAGGHKDARRSIMDVPVGYLHGRNISVANMIDVADQSIGLPLRQHFHLNYGEVFVLGRGNGELYVRAVAPGEKNAIKPEIVVAQDIPIGYEQGLEGVSTKLSLDWQDPQKRIVRVTPGIAHTFVLSPGSLLIPFLVDAPTGFNPHDSKNYVPFPLV